MNLPLSSKHAPKHSNSIPQTAVIKLKEYIQTYAKQKKKAALLHGPPGSCKTSSVHAIAEELGMELVDVNASDDRNSTAIEQRIGTAVNQTSLFGTNKLILIDEVDGLSGTRDRGGLSTLLALIKKSKYPIVMTANDPWDHKFSTLRTSCYMLEYASLGITELTATLKTVCEQEHIPHTETALKTLARRSGGDLRAALNDLQTIHHNLTADTITLDARGQTETLQQTLLKILKTTDTTTSRTALDTADTDHDELFLWLDENIVKEYTTPADLARAHDILSKADVFRGRITRRQHWRFLVHINELLTAGISHSKDTRYAQPPAYSQPTRLLRIWHLNNKTATKKNIAEKLAQHTHTSLKKTFHDTLPFFLNAIQHNKEFAQKLNKELELEEPLQSGANES